MPKKIHLFLLLLIFSPLLLASQSEFIKVSFQVSSRQQPVVLTLNNITTPDGISKGLMYVEKLQEKRGLFIDFGEGNQARIWMKNMRIPLDLIFLSSKGEVLSTVENAAPCKKAEVCSIYSATNARYVVEIKAGSIVKYNLFYVKSVSLK